MIVFAVAAGLALLCMLLLGVQFVVDGVGGGVKTVAQLLAERAEKVKAAQAIVDAAKAEGRELTTDEMAKADSLIAEAEELKAKADARARGDDIVSKVNAAVSDLSRPAPRPATRPAAPRQSRDDQGLADPDTALSSGHHDRVLDDPRNGYADFGQFASAVESIHTPGRKASDEQIKILAAASGMSQGVGSEGGVLVPPTYSNMIWDGMSRDPDNLANMCDRYTVTGESLSFKRENETSRADGSRDGGVLAYWMQEAGQITGSKVANLEEMKIEPHELSVLIYVTNKLLRNSSIALGQYLSRKAGRAITFKLNDAIINGDGVGKPQGILVSGCKVEQAKEANQVADTVVFGNVRKMRSRIPPWMRSQYVWLINQEVAPHLETMTLTVGTAGVPVYMPASGISTDGYDRLYGRPVMPVEYCQAPGTVGDIIAWVPSTYCLGLRGGVSSDVSIHLRFDYAETAFRFIFEADGQEWANSALTPYKGSQTLSPVVTVAER